MAFSRPQPEGRPISRRTFLQRVSLAAGALGLASAVGCLSRPAASNLGPLGLGKAGAGLLFYAGFDRALDAIYAVGDPAARAAGARLWRVLGAEGQALAAYPGGAVLFQAVGNIQAAAGTMEFGVKLLTGFGDTPKLVHRFLLVQDTQMAGAIIVEAAPPEIHTLRVRFHKTQDEYGEISSNISRAWQIGEWHHVAIVWDQAAGDARLYMDGEPVGAAGVASWPAALDGILVIGSGDGGDMPAFAEIDDFRVFDRARTDADIRGDFVRFDVWSRAQDSASWSPGVPPLLSLDLLAPPQHTVALVSDAHFAENGSEEGMFTHDWRSGALLEQIAGLKPAAVLHCGDMTAHFPHQQAAFASAAQRCKKAHSRIGAPVHWVPGNHDVGNKPALAATVGKVIGAATLDLYRAQFGDDFYSFDVGDCHMIVLDSQLFNAEPLPAAAQQWEWLQADLESAQGRRFTFAFLHTPLFWAAPDDPGGDNYEVIDEPARSRLLDLLQTHAVSAVFAGHSHHPFNNLLGATRFWTLPSITFARTFGDNYGAPSQATLYDEWKLGYYLLRIYAEDFVVTPIAGYPRAFPATPLQATALSPLMRFAPRQAREIADGLLGLVAAPPPIVRGRWDPTYATDDLVGATDAEEERQGWTSAGHAKNTDDEWISVELAQEQTVAAVEVVSRKELWRFPVAFSIETSLDGQSWLEAARQERPGTTTVTTRYGFAPRPARFVRVRSLRMRPPEPFRMALSELRVLDADGVNHALTGRARAGSMEDPSAFVDDRAWHLPASLGAKWARVSPPAFAWPGIEVRPGVFHLSPSQERALSIGLPDGVKLVLPLDPQNARYATAAERQRAFGEFVGFLAGRFGRVAAGWEVPYAGQPAAEFAGLLSEAAKQLAASGSAGPLVAGPFSTGDSALIDSIAGQVDAAILSLDLTEDAAQLRAQIEACRKVSTRLRGSPGVWAELRVPDGDTASSPAVACRMARAVIRCQEAGIRCFWSAPPATPGGLLDAMFDPTELYYTFQTLASLFDAGVVTRLIQVKATTRPKAALEIASFAAKDRLYVACWQTASAGAGDRLAAVQTSLEIEVGPAAVEKVLAVDTLSAAGQYVKFDLSEGVARVHGLHVGDHPVVLVLFISS